MSDKVVAYVILDLETTGLSTIDDQILEIGAIAITEDLEEVSRFHAVVKFNGCCGDEYVQKMHTSNALLAECLLSDMDEEQADFELSKYLKSMVSDEKVTLMGNSIHFDQAFLKQRMPFTAGTLHYRLMDIGGFGRWLTLCKLPCSKTLDMPHRAMTDCEIELSEAQQMRDLIVELSNRKPNG